MSTPRILVAILALAALAACTPPYPKCKTDKHCAEKGEVCVDGLCKQCRTDEECKNEFTCKDNACVAPPECRLDSDCGEGNRCRHDKCVPECTTARECAGGEKCEKNRCLPDVECAADGDCAGGKSCREGHCVAAAAEEQPDPAEGAEAERLRRLQACTLEVVLFEFNDFALPDSARASLDRNAECIRFKKRPVTVSGHADERGTEEYNLVLAEKRANAAKRYLTGLGLDESSLRTVSFGEEKPSDPGHSDEAWAKNRRAELSFR